MALTWSGWTELILFTRGATNSSITNAEGKGAQWYVKYRSAKESAGKTKVEWWLYKRGRETSPKNLETTLQFYVNGSKIYSVARSEFNDANSDGSNHPHKRYTADANTKPTKTGSFVVEHDSDGSGSFTMQIKAAIYSTTLSAGTVRTVTLATNLPQTPCYWASNATVTIDRTYIAPGGKFRVSWSGATAGVSNNVTGYRVFYKIGNGAYTKAEDNFSNTSTEITLPQNAARGSKITVLVRIIDTKDITSADITNASSVVNPALNNLVINDYSGKSTNDIFSYKDGQISFKYTLPTKSTNQTIKAKVQVGNGNIQTHEKSPYTYTITDANWPKGESKMFKFWATDGEEDSATPVTLTLRRNLIEGEGSLRYQSYILTSTVPSGCTATLQLVSNGNNQKTIKVDDGRKVDIRTLFNSELSSKTTYSNLVVKLLYTNRVDNEEKTVSTNFTTPEISIKGTKLDEYYVDGNSDTITVTSPSDDDDWFYSGIDSIGEGKVLSRIKMKKKGYSDFYIKPSNSLTTIRTLDFEFTLASGDSTYKPYSCSGGFSSKKSGTWEEYGCNENTDINFGLNNIAYRPTSRSNFSSNDTVTYDFDDYKDYFQIAEGLEQGSRPYIWYKYNNVYDQTIRVSKNAQVTIDWREPARQIGDGNWSIQAIPSPKKDGYDYSIEYWNCIKEGMPLSTDLSIAVATSTENPVAPTAWLERSSDKIGWSKFYDFELSQNGTDPTKFNTSVPRYKLEATTVGQITSGSEDYIRLVVQTEGEQRVYFNYKNFEDKFLFAKHISPLIKFTNCSYSNGKITGQYETLDTGTNMDYSDTYKASIQNEGMLDKGDEEEGTLSFGYNIDSNTSFIYIAPILVTSLQATYEKDNEKGVDFTTEYETTSYEYIVCYNTSPTVAYRANYLGINTSNPGAQADTVLEINAYNSRNKIYLRGATGDASIDLSNKSMIGFVVDCGSWSNISGGIIPGGDTPTGLAQIAYTGEIGDLEQNRADIIIITGGDAPSTSEEI